MDPVKLFFFTRLNIQCTAQVVVITVQAFDVSVDAIAGRHFANGAPMGRSVVRFDVCTDENCADASQTISTFYGTSLSLPMHPSARAI